MRKKLIGERVTTEIDIKSSGSFLKYNLFQLIFIERIHQYELSNT